MAILSKYNPFTFISAFQAPTACAKAIGAFAIASAPAHGGASFSEGAPLPGSSPEQVLTKDAATKSLQK
jgi:hypothetical protein